MTYLSKSEFKLARTCATKLFYRKLQYPSVQDDDCYLSFLADGGFMIEAVAKLLHPDGIEIGFEGGAEASAARTMEALQADHVTLFEATIIAGNMLARVDILRKVPGRLEVIEVKAKSIDSLQSSDPFRGTRGRIRPEWKPYLEDVAFQAFIVGEVFPAVEIEPCLCLVDKSQTTTIDSIFARFELSRPPAADSSRFLRPTVHFTGDVSELRQHHCLRTVSVRAEVDEMMPDIVADAGRFAASVTPLRKLPAPIGVHCRSCEYRNTSESSAPDGFRECWGSLADVDPHVLDFYHASSIGGRSAPLINQLVRQGRASLSDIEESDLAKATGEVGPIAQRQRIQRTHTLAGSEFIGKGLHSILAAHAFPLHFVDFETSRTALPYHAGMKPYEQTAFQWSCHSLRHDDEELTHTEWLNVVDGFPNVAFARALMAQVGRFGTVYTWSHHERSVLADILRQMDSYAIADKELRSWLSAVLEGDGITIVDLCEAAKHHYFHPAMRGRLSIKYVIPPIWQTNMSLHRHPQFSRYHRLDERGCVVNPYKTLPALPFGDGDDADSEVVVDGVGAMRAYQSMLYGLTNDPAHKRQWSDLLRQYCRLDTASMVMIWLHWRQRSAAVAALPSDR